MTNIQIFVEGSDDLKLFKKLLPKYSDYIISCGGKNGVFEDARRYNNLCKILIIVDSDNESQSTLNRCKNLQGEFGENNFQYVIIDGVIEDYALDLIEKEKDTFAIKHGECWSKFLELKKCIEDNCEFTNLNNKSDRKKAILTCFTRLFYKTDKKINSIFDIDEFCNTLKIKFNNIENEVDNKLKILSSQNQLLL